MNLRDWIRREIGSVEAEKLKAAIAAIYGEDRTFSVPILTMCALAGCLGPLPDAFRGIPALPFELAALPQRLFRYLGLPVVSYALPALIVIGQVQHHHLPSASGLLRRLRERMRTKTLDHLERIQPSSGGFLEAVPLTAFVTMSLAGADGGEHPVTGRAIEFLRGAARPDGSWPIDVDLATWLTTLSIQALSAADGQLRVLDPEQRRRLREWLLEQQFREIHPYTGAAPGGWAWTDLPGGVPDADDTAGALLALRRLGEIDARTREAAEWGVRWLLGLQNRDGGIPTFCRGWGKLPFDRSAADLTAHALRAFDAWHDQMPRALGRRLDRAERCGRRYLRRTQRGDGSWVPLWFGNQDAPRCENPTYGTVRVLLALGESSEAEAGTRWLVAAQNADGGWGGAGGVASSLEETALALEALAHRRERAPSTGVDDALSRGTAYLLDRLVVGDDCAPAPIGFYFAKLWYFERLYPRIFVNPRPTPSTPPPLASAARCSCFGIPTQIALFGASSMSLRPATA